MDKNLKWRHLKALNQIYKQGYTKNNIQGHPYIQYLLRHEYLKPKLGKPDVLEQGIGFKKEYEKEHLINFQYYQAFLVENDVLFNQTNYGENDIKTLMFIKEHKGQIITDKYTRKKFSAIFFKDESSKHLDDNPGLENAVLSILGIPSFPGKDPKDQQYKFVVDCINPKCIVLCENIDFLLLPWVSRESNIELWYAGGNNIEKLNHLPPINLPIYYSCDWDCEGLKIYERIKEKINQIEILYPSALHLSKSVYVKKHNTDWNYEKPFSGLTPTLYNEQATSLINSLIKDKKWIEEESNDLIEMMTFV